MPRTILVKVIENVEVIQQRISPNIIFSRLIVRYRYSYGADMNTPLQYIIEGHRTHGIYSHKKSLSVGGQLHACREGEKVGGGRTLQVE